MAVLFVFESDDHAALLDIGFTWGDVFQIEVSPAVTAEDGLRLGPEVLARRQV
jgi:hypothetical protein